MARRFVRIDLSDVARDFRPIAVEPGVPLLDKSYGNAKILFRWLGGLTGEPEWDGESVSFYARDDHGGRLEDVHCQAASDEDLKGTLRGDVEAIRERLSKVKPETSTERAVHKIVSAVFVDLVDNPNRVDRDNYFFRYRDVNGRWRLVWCWGYQRMDQQPAPSLVCTDDDCNLLFVRRPGESLKCPSCEANLALRPVKKRLPRRGLRAILLLLLLAALLYWWLTTRNQLVPVPDQWSGPVGSRVAFKVMTPGLLGMFRRDVTREVVAMSDDPRIARVDRLEPVVVAANPGKTKVHFLRGDHSSTASLTVAAPPNPTRIVLEPDPVEFGVGTTVRLKLFGEYEDGSRLDLTDQADWQAKNDGVVFACDGLLEGLKAGGAKVLARYLHSPDAGNYLEAAASVSVANLDFKSLEMSLEPLPMRVGRSSKLTIDAVTAENKRYSVLESSRLKTAVEPAGLVGAYPRWFEGRRPGHGSMKADFNAGLAASGEFEVINDPAVTHLVVNPEQTQMIVGEILDLGILSPSAEPIELASANPAVVEVTRDNRLIGRSQGTAKVEVKQPGQKSCQVDVTVVPGVVQSIAVDPRRVVVPVADSRAMRVMARTEDGRRVELAPDVVKCEQPPAPAYAEFDAKSLALRGVKPTDANKPEQLVLAYDKHKAQAPVEVIAGPQAAAPEAVAVPLRPDQPVEVRIVSDQGASVKFPVGAEFNDFRVEARYQDGMTRMVTKKAELSTPEPADKALVTFSKGRILGARAGRTTVEAKYDGVAAKTGLEVEVQPEVDVDEIRLTPSPVKILPAETVAFEAFGFKNGKSVGALTGIDRLAWKTDNPKSISVKGPSITGAALGKGNVTAQLGPVVSRPAEVSVVKSIEEDLALLGIDGKPLGLIRMGVGEGLTLGTDLVISRGGVDFSQQCKVEALDKQVVAFDPETRTLKALAPGQSPITLVVGGKAREAVVQVVPRDPDLLAMPITGLRIEPREATVHPGQGLVYEVTGEQGGLRRALGPADGLKLSTADAAVAEALPQAMSVEARRTGQTDVVAKLGPQQASARLNVVAGTAAPIVVGDRDGVVVTGPGGGWFGDDGYHVWGGDSLVGPYRGHHYVDGGGVDYVGGVDRVVGALAAADRIFIEPPQAAVKVDEPTPTFNVVVQRADGTRETLPVAPDCTDDWVLRRDPDNPGRFIGRSVGRTQVRASFGERTAFADVTVTGDRFARIETEIAEDPDKDSFEVLMTIDAIEPETPLEYRIYPLGETPPDTWTASERDGTARRVTLRSGPIAAGPPSTFYHLVLEARDPGDSTIQKCPYTFRVERKIQKVPATTTAPDRPAEKPDAAEPGEKPATDMPAEKAAEKKEPSESPAEPAAKPKAKAKSDTDDPFAGGESEK